VPDRPAARPHPLGPLAEALLRLAESVRERKPASNLPPGVTTIGKSTDADQAVRSPAAARRASEAAGRELERAGL
jgi:hypothetical protein